jgi:mannose-1-phosphate guanylyltransferase
MSRYQPSITDALPPGAELEPGPRRAEALAAFYDTVPSISVDYGVMEKSTKVFMVEARFRWSDLGTWEAWGETRRADDRGNRTEGDVVVRDGDANIVYSEAGGRVALLGVSNLVVVRTGDVTLVIPRERIQEVRDLVQKMREENDEDAYL